MITSWSEVGMVTMVIIGLSAAILALPQRQRWFAQILVPLAIGILAAVTTMTRT